ncbi:MAG: YdcH family protein [Planktomarina sp.]
MSLNSRITELQRKHQRLTQAVEVAERSPSADHLEIAGMKKQKLRLKEEISRLSAG